MLKVTFRAGGKSFNTALLIKDPEGPSSPNILAASEQAVHFWIKNVLPTFDNTKEPRREKPATTLKFEKPPHPLTALPAVSQSHPVKNISAGETDG